jgi:hypothetical protein
MGRKFISIRGKINFLRDENKTPSRRKFHAISKKKRPAGKRVVEFD